jgi:hypothetical protein
MAKGLDSLTVWTMSDEGPEFGYGQGRRPLWNERDRDAERVRDILRGAGLAEFSDTRPGFVVEGGRASGMVSGDGGAGRGRHRR